MNKERINIVVIQNPDSSATKVLFNEPVIFKSGDYLHLEWYMGLNDLMIDAYIIRKESDGEEGKDIS